MELKLNTSKRIVDLLNANKTVVVAAGHKFIINNISNDIIDGIVYFGNYPFPIKWKANGFPVDTKDAPENYYLRLIEKK